MNKKNKKKPIRGLKELQTIVDNLHDLSDLSGSDSEDDCYFQTATVESPASLYQVPDDDIVERRLEQLFGIPDDLRENKDDQEMFSVQNRTDILETKRPIRRFGTKADLVIHDHVMETDDTITGSSNDSVTEKESQTSERCSRPETNRLTSCVGEIVKQHDDLGALEINEDNVMETDDASVEPSRDNVTETESQISESCSRPETNSPTSSVGQIAGRRGDPLALSMNGHTETQEESEKQCLGEIIQEPSHIQTDDTSAGPSRDNIPETESQISECCSRPETNSPTSSVDQIAGRRGDPLALEINGHTETQEESENLTQREIEIQQCLDEIIQEPSHIQTDDTSAGPSRDNVPETETQTSEHHPRPIPSRNRNRTINAARTRQPREWKHEENLHDVPDFKNPIQPQSAYNHKTKPIDVFKNFFTEYLVQVLVEQTNRYASQKNSKNFAPVSAEEMNAYLGILIMMGLNPLPNMDLYWSNDPFYNNAEISKVMPIKRFKKITENLHINDNEKEPKRESPEYDRLYKLRPMITELNKVFQQEMANSSTQSIDECMVKFKGRSSLKQYMPKKPIKRGFKVWARCDSKTGYLYTFEVYTGKGDSMEDEGLGYNVVTKLAAGLPEDTLLAFDNFFTSCNLMDSLYERKIFAVGTVRTNRKDLPDILKKSQPKHLRLEKNQFAAITAKPITAIKWLDTRDVTVLTTAHHPTDVVFVKRTQKDGTRKEVLCPKAIAQYTLTMGGVDHFDHFRSSYPINRKCRKFWMRLFFYMFDAAIINSYITYNTAHTVTTHSHRDFRLRLARELISNYTTKKNRLVLFKNKKGSKFGVPDEIRLLNVGIHLPEEGNTYKRCRFCSTKKLEKRTKIVCSTCQIALCAKNCFKSFHEASPQE